MVGIAYRARALNDREPTRRYGVVDVHRVFSDVGGRVILGTPKCHQSRTVPLPRFLVTEIAAATAGRTYPQLARILRALCAVADRCRLPLVAAVAVTVAVNPAQAIGSNRPRSSQGMACVRSGQAAAWPLVSGRSVRSGLRGQA